MMVNPKGQILQWHSKNCVLFSIPTVVNSCLVFWKYTSLNTPFRSFEIIVWFNIDSFCSFHLFMVLKPFVYHEQWTVKNNATALMSSFKNSEDWLQCVCSKFLNVIVFFFPHMNCSYAWRTTEWSECRVDALLGQQDRRRVNQTGLCGGGVQNREVYCIQANAELLNYINNNQDKQGIALQYICQCNVICIDWQQETSGWHRRSWITMINWLQQLPKSKIKWIRKGY